jgi:multidrug efflux system membrane fusion protein
MRYRLLVALLGPGLAAAGLLTGCAQGPPAVAPAEAPVIPVSHPAQRQVTDFIDFTGRTVAKDAVDVRARVTGYLMKMPFEEGAEVKKDQLLFDIDPRPYQAQYDQAESQVALAKAQLKLAQTTYERDRAIGSIAISAQQLDQDQASVDEAQARIAAAKAALEVYKLNLEFTKVKSPIAGQVSRYYLTIGNLVVQDQTLLTTVVSLDPMYAYFDMDEPTLLRLRRAVSEGRLEVPKAGTIAVYMGLQGEDTYPHKGTINFVNNQVNPSTGSITVRGEFPNPKPAKGKRLLAPGMFARIRLPIGQPHPALLVIDRAIGSDQGLKFLYVLDKDNKVQQRRVTLGALQEDGLRVIEPSDKPGEGIKADDWVVVGAVLQVRPRMVVQPEPIAMPTLGPAPITR